MIFYPAFFPGLLSERNHASGFIHSLAKEIGERSKSCGKLFGIYTDNDAFMYASVLAAWKAGCGFVPLNNKFPEERLRHIISETGIRCVIGNNNSKEAIEKLGIDVIIFNDDKKWMAADQQNNDLPVEIKNDPSAFAYVLFTSGSTGIPKGIPVTFGNLEAFAEDLRTRFDLTASDKVINTYELSFDLSIGSALLAWMSGAMLYICPMDGIIPLDAVRMIMDHQVNIVSMAPSAVNILKKYRILGEADLSFIDTTIFGAEALPYQYVLDWKMAAKNSSMVNAYGPTETTIWATYYTVDNDTAHELVNGLVPIGKPARNVDCHIHQQDSISTNANQGELWISGTQLFEGYLNNTQKSEEVLTTHNGKKFYRTGDLVEMLDSGDLIYLNRLDNQVKINGYRVEPGEVEYKIRTTLGISACAVIPVTTDHETWLLAVLEKETLTDEERKRLQEAITFYMLPRKFITVQQLPLNHNGKIDRLQLKKEYAGE